MTPEKQSLLQGLAELESTLSSSWQNAQQLSPEMLPYREDWLSQFRTPPRGATQGEFQAALARGCPAIVGDFHPLRRSGHSLATLLRNYAGPKPLGVVLELLPLGPAIGARDFLSASAPPLITGQSVADAYPELLDVLIKSQGFIVGTWAKEHPWQRDSQAASSWAELHRLHPNVHWVLFFGDWHLADNHLPEKIRQLGGKPTVLHQSPEPLWEGAGESWFHPFLKMEQDHWAWLHTPPLARKAAMAQEEDGPWDIHSQESAEYLAEEIAFGLAELLEIPSPTSLPVLVGPESWQGFYRNLPLDHRSALQKDQPPNCMIALPGQAECWLPDAPSLALLFEAAGHCLLADWPLGRRIDPKGRAQARAFRRLWARLTNPFLTELTYPDWQSGVTPVGFQATPFGKRWLAVDQLGASLGDRLARHADLNKENIKGFLNNQEQYFKWSIPKATIPAA
jgi:hypothetical protein